MAGEVAGQAGVAGGGETKESPEGHFKALDFITRWKPLKGVKHGNTQI